MFRSKEAIVSQNGEKILYEFQAHLKGLKETQFGNIIELKEYINKIIRNFFLFVGIFL